MAYHSSKLGLKITISLFILSIFFPFKVMAQTSFTLDEIEQHNTISDCYMAFEGSVYNITNYLNAHDRYMNIRDWCGRDMTEDFKDKAGRGIDHKASSYALLENYKVGVLSDTTSNTVIENNTVASDNKETNTENDEYFVEIEGQEMKALTINEIAELWEIDPEALLVNIIKEFDLRSEYTINTVLEDMRDEYKFSPAQIKDIAEDLRINNSSNDEYELIDAYDSKSLTDGESTVTDKKSKNPYNFIVPFATTMLLYFLTYFISISKWGKRYYNRSKFNLTWNTILVISLIPSAIFGLYLIFRYSIPALNNVNFDFLYWHVEGSIVFATLVLLHFLLRFKQYIVPIKMLFLRRK